MSGMQWCVGLLFLGACAGSVRGPNVLERSLLQLELTERQAEKQRLEQRIWRLEREIIEAREKANVAQEDSWRAELLLGEKAAELFGQLQTLAAAEEDLAAAMERKAEIDAELASVRELEEQVAQKDQRLKELGAQLEVMEAEVAQKEADHAKRRDEIAARFAELEERSKVLDALDGLVAKALEDVLAIAGPFFKAPGTEREDKEGAEGGDAGADKEQEDRQETGSGDDTSGGRRGGNRGGRRGRGGV